MISLCHDKCRVYIRRKTSLCFRSYVDGAERSVITTVIFLICKSYVVQPGCRTKTPDRTAILYGPYTHRLCGRSGQRSMDRGIITYKIIIGIYPFCSTNAIWVTCLVGVVVTRDTLYGK